MMRRLPRNVYVVSAVSFFQDAASELVYPVLPLFITGTLGAPASVLGLIEGVADGTSAIGKALSGRLADRFRRKPLVALGYGISSVAKPMLGLAGVWPVALAARFVDRVGKGIRTSPRDALIAAEVTPELRGRAFGLHRASDSAGAVVGPLLGLGLYELLDHRLRPLFLLAFIPAAVSVGLVAFLREHPPPPRVQARAGELPAPPTVLGTPFWRTVGFLSVFGLLNFSDALLLLRANELGLDFVGVALAYALYNFVYAGLSLPAGIISDRIPRRLVFAVGMVAFAITYAGLGLADSSTWVWILLPLYGAFTGLTDGVSKAWVADLLPRERMGTGMGYYQAITGLCALVASVWAGLAWGHAGRTPLLVSGGVVAVLAVVLALGGRWLEGGGAPQASTAAG